MKQSYFIYNNKKYEYNTDLFNDPIDGDYLVSSFDPFISIPNETIEAFINFTSTQSIQITKSNVLHLNYFSYRYQIPKLTQMTEEFISGNYKEVINEILSTAELTYQMERIISKYLIEFIGDNRLANLSISQIYRIIVQYLNENDHLTEENEKDIP